MPLKDAELAQTSAEDLVAELAGRFPLEKRLAAGIPLQQALFGIPLEQRLAAGIPYEQALFGIPFEKRIGAGIPPEKLFADIPPEQRLLLLYDDALSALPDSYLRSLSPAIKEAIRLRIGRPA